MCSICLPMYSKLKNKECSEEEYELGQKNLIILGCRKMKHYTLKYLKLGVCLLADVYENFRKRCSGN